MTNKTEVVFSFSKTSQFSVSYCEFIAKCSLKVSLHMDPTGPYGSYLSWWSVGVCVTFVPPLCLQVTTETTVASSPMSEDQTPERTWLLARGTSITVGGLLEASCRKYTSSPKPATPTSRRTQRRALRRPGRRRVTWTGGQSQNRCWPWFYFQIILRPVPLCSGTCGSTSPVRFCHLSTSGRTSNPEIQRFTWSDSLESSRAMLRSDPTSKSPDWSGGAETSTVMLGRGLQRPCCTPATGSQMSEDCKQSTWLWLIRLRPDQYYYHKVKTLSFEIVCDLSVP